MTRNFVSMAILLVVMFIAGEARGMTESDIREALDAFLRDHAPRSLELVQWELRRGDRLPRNGKIVRLEKVSGADWDKQVPVRVVVETDAGKRKTIWVTMDLISLRSVVVASETLPIGHIIGEGDVRLETKNDFRSNKDHLSDMDQVLGKRVRRPVSRGTCLKNWHLNTSEGNTKKGSLVTIVAIRGYVRVEAPGKLLESGKAGDTVRVVNLTSGKLIHASVIDNNTVSVPH
jgi:flagella basal body P-ring formation protein FlgA